MQDEVVVGGRQVTERDATQRNIYVSYTKGAKGQVTLWDDVADFERTIVIDSDQGAIRVSPREALRLVSLLIECALEDG